MVAVPARAASTTLASFDTAAPSATPALTPARASRRTLHGAFITGVSSHLDGYASDAVESMARDSSAHTSLAGSDETAVIRGNKRIGAALTLGTTGTADPVSIGVRRGGHVKVDDMRDLFNVETAGGDIGGDEDIETLGTEAIESALALVLRHIPLQRHGLVTSAVKLACQLACPVLGAGKDNGRDEAFLSKNALEEVELLGSINGEEGVLDRLKRQILVELNDVRLVEQSVGQMANLTRHGGGEEHVLAIIGQSGKDTPDVG